MGYIWSKDELKALAEMAKAKIPIEKMAEVIPQRFVKSIQCKIKDLGLAYRVQKPVDWTKLREILVSSKPVEL